ncbi:nitrate reductase molybdenum cofactor assembly chaperone [Microtetraspora sp. AC03309]|uniref:nitrate reductase molybdenum cofactor assembly chaperone n=1 Tax=Microtetraspora sp. AC03309 TaxID=2779376 RepID=UPI001E60B7BC|nr:nitrate reductase molybdenum cofactor assembly chaperone [Microtetraspora sp. AC03309]MCC5576532.1 nitrate reductase molybdenum cofactor assembly chaperone [Microtetraspora sp. AC03309]
MTGAEHAFKLASVLLQYPTMALFTGIDRLDEAGRAAPRAAREEFAAFLAWLRATPPGEVAGHYVDTFDLRRHSALYLTYYRYGDTRRRGTAMLAYKAAYRRAGFHPPDAELPDFVPLVLEFAALSREGVALLRRRRADLDLLRRALGSVETPYAHVVEAVCALLPKLRRGELEAVRALWESGPPTEEVGLEPFAPPEYLSGQERRP